MQRSVDHTSGAFLLHVFFVFLACWRLTSRVSGLSCSHYGWCSCVFLGNVTTKGRNIRPSVCITCSLLVGCWAQVCLEATCCVPSFAASVVLMADTPIKSQIEAWLEWATYEQTLLAKTQARPTTLEHKWRSMCVYVCSHACSQRGGINSHSICCLHAAAASAHNVLYPIDTRRRAHSLNRHTLYAHTHTHARAHYSD